MLVGGSHAKVGLKQQQSPRGSETKEEELKSLLTVVQNTDMHTCCWLWKISVCGTSEQTMSASTSETGLALTAVCSVGTYI